METAIGGTLKISSMKGHTKFSILVKLNLKSAKLFWENKGPFIGSTCEDWYLYPFILVCYEN